MPPRRLPALPVCCLLATILVSAACNRRPSTPLGPSTVLPGATNAPHPGTLPGRLLVLTPTEPGAAPVLAALDMATGQASPLWPVFEADEAGFNAHDWAIEPGGRRIAYLRKGGTGEARVVLRALTPDAPRRDFPVPAGTADVLLWLPDGSGLVYGALDVAENDQHVAKVTRWALRRLDLATGQDEEVMALDEAALAGKFPRLVGFDPSSGHVALATGPGENFFVDGIRLFDTASGQPLASLKARDEGFQAAASPDGRVVAYGDCQGCQQGAGGVVKLLDLADGTTRDAAVLDLGAKVVGLRWSPDGLAIAWTAYDQGHPQPEPGNTLGLARRGADGWTVPALAEPKGNAVAMAPDGRWLLGTRGLYDLAGGARSDPPWPLPGGLAWSEAPWRVVGWVPDRPR